jgi:cytochrome c oxidase assembly factor CtaG
LVAAFLGPAVAWAIHLVVIYPLVPVACTSGSRTSLVVVTVGLVAVALACGVYGWLHRGLGRHADASVAERRAGFLARAAVPMSVVFVAATLAESAPIVTDDPCLEHGFFPSIPSVFAVPDAHAHPLLGATTPREAVALWTPDPIAAGALAVALLAHAAVRRQRRGPRRRNVAFHVAIACLALALVSPLDTFADALFSAHMVQHLVLVLVVAPLLVLAAPATAFLAIAPSPVRRRLAEVWRRVRLRASRPAFASAVAIVHMVVVFAWHAPPLYEAALASRIVHALEHATFLVTAVAFWGCVARLAGAGQGGVALLLLFATATACGVLGALIALSPTPWYRAYAAGTPAFWVSPLEDQQLAGLLMWVPGNAAYAVAGLAAFRQWVLSAARAGAPS